MHVHRFAGIAAAAAVAAPFGTGAWPASQRPPEFTSGLDLVRLRIEIEGHTRLCDAVLEATDEIARLRVADELRNQYLVGFTPNDQRPAEGWRSVAVETPVVTIATRAGYYRRTR